MEINTSILKKILYVILILSIFLLLIMEDVLHMSFVSNKIHMRVCIIQIYLFIVLCVSGIFCMERYVNSQEYRFFRSLQLSSFFRGFVICCKVLPCALVYTLLCILFWNVNNGTAVYQAIYSFWGIIVISIAIYDLYTIIKKWIVKNRCISIILLCIPLLAVIISVFIYKGGNSVFMILYSKFFVAKWYILCLYFVWLILYSTKDHTYEIIILNTKRRKIKEHSKKIFTNMYCNLFYKDIISSLSNPIVAAFYIIALILGCLSAIYHFNIHANYLIAIIYTFVTSTLSEEIMKDDMSNISFIRTLPISQHKYFVSKIFSVSTVLLIPSLTFLEISLLNGSYSVMNLIVILCIVLIINILLCAMQCVLIMRYLYSQDKFIIILTILLFITVIFPALPVLYLLIATKKAQKIFCGGRD